MSPRKVKRRHKLASIARMRAEARAPAFNQHLVERVSPQWLWRHEHTPSDLIPRQAFRRRRRFARGVFGKATLRHNFELAGQCRRNGSDDGQQ